MSLARTEQLHEKLLRDFLTGAESASTLNREVVGAVTITGPKRSSVQIVDIESGQHLVTAAQLVRVCDAVSKGALDPSRLEAIAFCLIASDYFRWDRGTADGARVASVLDDWSGTEIGYPLTVPNVVKARHFLTTGEQTFTASDLVPPPGAE